jgi:hypothetical protein
LADRTKFGELAAQATSLAGKPISAQDIDRIATNAITVCTDSLDHVAVGVFSNASLLNHSCHPNCVIVFDLDNGVSGKVVCIRPIGQGEELTISYLDLADVHWNISQRLKSEYFFDCGCNVADRFRCGNLKCSGILRASDSQCPCCSLQSPDFDRRKAMIIKLMSSKSDRSVLDLKTLVPNDSPAVFRLLDNLGLQALDNQDFQQAFVYFREALTVAGVLYPKFSSNLGIYSLKVAKLASLLSSFDLAEKFYRISIEILGICYGPENRLLQTTSDELRLMLTDKERLE